jgi:hypothetical protein
MGETFATTPGRYWSQLTKQVEELVQAGEDGGNGKSESKDSKCLMPGRTRDIVRGCGRAMRLINGRIHSEQSFGVTLISQ